MLPTEDPANAGRCVASNQYPVPVGCSLFPAPKALRIGAESDRTVASLIIPPAHVHPVRYKSLCRLPSNQSEHPVAAGWLSATVPAKYVLGPGDRLIIRFWSNVLEDQDGFFQFLMDIGVRMGNKRKRD